MDVSDDEVFLGWLAVAGVVRAVWLLFAWGTPRFGRRGTPRYWIVLGTLVAWMAVGLVLTTGSAHDVRQSGFYLFTMVGLGMGWVAALSSLCPWLGLSVEDDALGRSNDAAAASLCGALLASALVYSGGNVGEGPTLWSSLESAGLGTLAWLGLWLGFELVCHPSWAIAEGRDLASGLRLGGLLLALGLLLGRGVAGRWISLEATWLDVLSWMGPCLALCLVAGVLERMLRPRRGRPFPPWLSHGLGPAAAYGLFAVMEVLRAGSWQSLLQ